MPAQRGQLDKKREPAMTDSSAGTAKDTLSPSDWQPGVLISGGRDFIPNTAHATWFKYWLRAVQPAFLLSGRARGVDIWAEAIALAQGVEVQPCPITPSDWAAYGGAAGPMRNTMMLEVMLNHGGGYCVVFDGGPGTADMLHKAEKRTGIWVINMQKPSYTAPASQRSLLGVD